MGSGPMLSSQAQPRQVWKEATVSLVLKSVVNLTPFYFNITLFSCQY